MVKATTESGGEKRSFSLWRRWRAGHLTHVMFIPGVGARSWLERYLLELGLVGRPGMRLTNNFVYADVIVFVGSFSPKQIYWHQHYLQENPFPLVLVHLKLPPTESDYLLDDLKGFFSIQQIYHLQEINPLDLLGHIKDQVMAL